ncbi:MAG: hypothetical protein IPG04_04685 [Polyangiaceae bacterium]|nr:hypothetical protein [Polyangiaceae bacterium]
MSRSSGGSASMGTASSTGASAVAATPAVSTPGGAGAGAPALEPLAGEQAVANTAATASANDDRGDTSFG